MPKPRGQIRINAYTEVRVESVIAYLTALGHAYNSILVFEATIDQLQRTYREPRYSFYPGGLAFLLSPSAIRRTRSWPPTPAEVASFVPVAEQLVLAHVRLQSEGFWEFIGQLNPLEVIRQYLNDRHERRKGS